MTISNQVLDDLLSGVERPEDLLGETGLMQDLKVRLMERMLGADSAAVRRAAAFATRLERETKGNEAFVTRAFEICFGRQPDQQALGPSSGTR